MTYLRPDFPDPSAITQPVDDPELVEAWRESLRWTERSGSGRTRAMRSSVRWYGFTHGGVPIPEEQRIIEHVLRCTQAGFSARAICGGLNKRKIPGPVGKPWNWSSIELLVLRALAFPVYLPIVRRVISARRDADKGDLTLGPLATLASAK